MKHVIILSLTALFAVGCNSTLNLPIPTVDESEPVLVDRRDEAEKFIIDMVAQSMVEHGEDLGKLSNATIECRIVGVSTSGADYTYLCDALFPEYQLKAVFVCEDATCRLESHHGSANL